MKKMKSAVLIGLILLIAIPVDARIRYGVKGGMNISNVHFNKNLVEGDAIASYHVGPMAEWMVWNKFGLDAALLYSQKGVGYHSKNYHTGYLELPVNFKWKFDVPFVKAYVAAGPYLAMAIADKEWSAIPVNGSPKATADKWDVGGNIGIGVEVMKHLQVGITYSRAFKDSYELKRTSGSKSYAQNNVWAISAAFLF